MSARKIDGWWYADFRVFGERYRKRSPANTRAEAQRFEQYLRKEIALRGSLKHLEPEREPKAKSRSSPTFASFAERWLREYVPGNYRWSEQMQRASTLRSRMVPFFGATRLDRLSAAVVEQYKTCLLADGLSKKTVNNHLTILRKCLSVAVEWGELEVVPPFKILRVKAPPFRFLHQDETRELLKQLPTGLWREMATLALHTGLRYSELIALRWSDIDFTTRLICVQRAEIRKHVGPTKNDRVRYVPMSSDTEHALRSLGPSSGRVFELNGGSIWYETAWKRLRNACRRAKIEHVSWHDFRHTFATDLVRSKVPLPVVQKLLGHGTIEMTMRYVHLADESLHDAIALLKPHEVWAAGGQRAATDAPTASLSKERAEQKVCGI